MTRRPEKKNDGPRMSAKTNARAAAAPNTVQEDSMSVTPDSTRIPAPEGFELCFPDDPGPVPEYMGADMYLGIEYDVVWDRESGVKVLAGKDGLHVQSADILAACQDLLTLFVKVRRAEAEHARNVRAAAKGVQR